MYQYLAPQHIKAFVQAALIEDVGPGDFTSLSTVPTDKRGIAQLLVKDHGIIAGVELAAIIFHEVDSEMVCRTFIPDGQRIEPGQIVLEVEGKAQSILKAERLVLNCMQRMSGIATYTR